MFKAINNSLEPFNVKDDFKGLSVEEVNKKTHRLNYAVCCLNLTGDKNVGGIIRTANLCGANNVLLIGRKSYDKRMTVGAHNYINVERVHALIDDDNKKYPEIDFNIFFSEMEKRNYAPVFIEQGGEYLHTIDFKKRMERTDGKTMCIVMGSESDGIPKEILKNGDIVSIYQLGSMRSHNVSIAAGIIMNRIMELSLFIDT